MQHFRAIATLALCASMVTAASSASMAAALHEFGGGRGPAAGMGFGGARGHSAGMGFGHRAGPMPHGFMDRAQHHASAWHGGSGFHSLRGWHGGRNGSRHHRWHHDHNWYGPALDLGVAGLIIGGSLADSQAEYSSLWDRCDQRYKSFRWSDGTYQPYGGGPRRLCPYLRG